MQTFTESFTRFFQIRNKIVYRDSFVSTRLIKEALEKQFRLISVEESPLHMRLKIIKKFLKYFELQSVPYILDITIIRNEDNIILSWYLNWFLMLPGQYFLIYIVMLLLLAPFVFSLNDLPYLLMLIIIGLPILGIIKFIDAFMVSKIVLNIFNKL